MKKSKGSRMRKMISQSERDKFPILKLTNARLYKATFGLMAFAAILPFLLPESGWLVDTSVMQWLGKFIPSAGKLAAVAQASNVVQAYIVITLMLSLVFGVSVFFRIKPLSEYLIADVTLSAPRGLFALWIKAVGGIIFWTLLIYLFYIFPGEEPSVDPRGSRGQLIVSLMVMTKPGLGIFGGFICGALTNLWFFWFYAIYSFFKLPLLALQSKR
jgi:hypothetical protein